MKTRATGLILRLAGLIFAVCALTQQTFAVPADPMPREVTQPDGTKFKLRLRGDEYFSWHETEDGYAIVQDAKDGFWKYAKPAKDKAEFRAVPNAKVRATDPVKLGLKKHDMPDSKVLREHIQKRRQELHPRPAESPAPAGGSSQIQPATIKPMIAVSGVKTIRNIVILACFSNHWDSVNNTVLPAYGRVDTNEYINLFNQIGYSTDGAAGSVKDYYKEMSYGKLTIESTIVKWVQLPREEAFYHDNQGEMTSNAVAAAKAAGFNFAPGDSDGDGWVDCLDIIHSGYGEEAGAGSNSVWSVMGGMPTIVTMDGVKMEKYHTEPAFRDNTGTNISRIGVICHETGHFFGLPDLYDTGSGTGGLGSWCNMSGGTWNGGGALPAHLSAWCKVFLGFAKPVALHSKTGVSLPRVEDNPVVGILRDGTATGEYFLVENRAKIGFDNSSDIYPGMIIYHIDSKSWGNNSVSLTHPGVKMEEADGNDTLGFPKGPGSQAGDAWTSTSGLAGGLRDQTGNTNTTAMLYQPGNFYSRADNSSYYTYNTLDNFSAAASNMTFNATTLKPAAPTGYALSSSGYNVAWRAASAATKYEIQEGALATLTSLSDDAESDDAMYDKWYVGGVSRVVTNASRGGTGACYRFENGRSLTLQKPFKVTASTAISYWVESDIVAGYGYIKGEISKDNGNTWITLATDSGSIHTWASRSFNATALAGLGINAGDQCILHFVSDIASGWGWNQFPGYAFAIDDIAITGTEIAGYGSWTSLDNNVTGTSYAISTKPAGIYAYRIKAYANGAWQGFGPEGEVTVSSTNHPPAWTSSPIAGADGNAGMAYSADLSSLASDPDINDAVTFSKVSGPAWLTITSDGLCSGTPGVGDAGLNTFTVRASDQNGGSTDVTLTISVISPFAHWPMNESAGPTINDVVSNFNGTAVGSLVYTQAGAQATAGNYAIAFNPPGTAVNVPALNIASNSVTITALVNPNGMQSYLAGLVSSPEFVFGFGANNNYLTYVRGGYLYGSATVTVPSNQWTFVALVVGPDVNPVLYMATNSSVLASYTVGRTDPAGTIFTNTSNFANSPWSRYNGLIDDITIYARQLNATAIGQLAAAAFVQSPTVMLTYPGDGSVLTNGTINLTASVVSNAHAITSVRFYDGLTYLGTSTSAPYNVNWSGMTNGTHVLSAKALYDAGSVVSSSSATVTVVAGLTPFQQWQVQYFGSTNAVNGGPNDDATGTGQNNTFKYAAGLDPTNAASIFTLTITNAANQPVLTFRPWASGRTYTPQWSTNLPAFNTLLTGDAPQTNGNAISVTDTNAVEPAKFYRINITYP